MSGLYHAHSGFRFLVLLLGFVNVAVLAAGIVQKQPFGKVHRIAGVSFVGSLHLQVLLGAGLVAMGRYYPALIGHMAMMVLAAVVAQVTSSVNRRRKTPTLTLPLAGSLIALVCIVGGVMSIGRGLFKVSAF